MLVLGIDAGGTKTVCQLANAQGDVLAESRGPGANLSAAGELEVEKVLHEVITATLPDDAIRVDALCLGMAGVDRPHEEALVRGILGRIGQRARALVVNDALIALEAGAPEAPGLVIISGTGSIAYGRDDRGRAARAGGWGHVLADEGSGYWLGRQALRAVMREADGRGPATLLTPRLLGHFQIQRAHDLVREIYPGSLKPTAIATLASQVQTAAQEGDAVASYIIHMGATELAAAARSVAHRLELGACAIVLAGGIFRGVPLMRVAVTERLAECLPDAVVRSLEREPAFGAVRLALRMVQGQSVVPSYIEDP